VIGSAAVLVAGLGTALGVTLSSPATPQWCGPVLSQVQIRTGHDSFPVMISTLRRLERQEHAPVAGLVSNFEAQARSGNINYVALGNVVWDLQKLNRACGQPASAYAGDVQ
jgi:hypothetical protein